jgi:hypothetical protein
MCIGRRVSVITGNIWAEKTDIYVKAAQAQGQQPETEEAEASYASLRADVPSETANNQNEHFSTRSEKFSGKIYEA